MAHTEFFESILEDVKKYKGTRMTLKASPLECLLVKKVSCDKLHPNPEDEFCDPKIGPSYTIISKYEEDMRQRENTGQDPFSGWDEPLYVEKMHPDGYTLINGHHRWAAALRMKKKKVPVKVVNMTHASDVRAMIENSTHDKRASFDLDEVVFCNTEEKSEKKLSFPFNMIYKERIRLGFTSLCHYLSVKGYDIWVYTSECYNLNYIWKLFNANHIKINGIITGVGFEKASKSEKKKMEQLLSNKYRRTININNEEVIFIDSDSKDFEQFDMTTSSDDWSSEVRDIIERYDDGRK